MCWRWNCFESFLLVSIILLVLIVLQSSNPTKISTNCGTVVLSIRGLRRRNTESVRASVRPSFLSFPGAMVPRTVQYCTQLVPWSHHLPAPASLHNLQYCTQSAHKAYKVHTAPTPKTTNYRHTETQLGANSSNENSQETKKLSGGLFL